MASSATKVPAKIKTTFGRTKCSPALDPHVVQGLVVTMPAQITWGDPLPVCGHLRVGDDLRITYPGFFFELKSRDKSLDAYRGNGAVELGDPEMDESSPAYEILKKTGELYFTVDGQHEYRDLSPGDYDIAVGYLSKLKTAPHHLKVVAGGWRKEFSDALLKEVCAGSLLADLAEYLELIHQGTLEDQDEAGQAEHGRLLDAAWRKGFSSSAKKLLGRYRSKLKSLGRLDTSIPLHVFRMSETTCPSRHIKAIQLLNIFAGMRLQD